MYGSFTVAASDARFNVLYLSPARQESARFEPVAFHLLTTAQYQERGRTALGATVMVPVPVGLYSNSNSLDDIAGMMQGDLDMFWELHPDGDADGVLIRLNSAFPCGLTCAWAPEEDRARPGLGFNLVHGPDCSKPEPEDPADYELYEEEDLRAIQDRAAS